MSDRPTTGLRRRTTRGVVVNGAYLMVVNSLGLLRGFIAAAILTTTEYGLWGVLAVLLGVFLALRQAGIGEKFVQDERDDAERAFTSAFTVELIFTGVLSVVMAASVPLIALAYGEPDVIWPALALVLVLPALALQSPVWIFYRRLDFARQRLLQGIDPVVTFVVTVVLAALGVGYWSLVIGAIAGAWTSAVVAVAVSPIPLRLGLDPGDLRRYAGFSAPLVIATVSAALAAQAVFLAADSELGLAGIGALYLAISLALYANKVDEAITQTIYPAVVAAGGRAKEITESFYVSNRLAMLWGIPFGVGVSLFAGDLIDHVLGEKWRPAELPLAVLGGLVAVNQIAFNWNAYMQARARTIPIGLAAATHLVATCAITVPFLLAHGLDGFALGAGIVGVITLLQRLWFVREIASVRQVLSNALAAARPTAIAVLAVVALRWVEPLGGGGDAALLEVAGFGVLVISVSALLERRLFAEILSHLGPAAPARAGVR